MPARESVSWLLLSLITLIYWIAPQSVRLLYSIRLAEFGASDLMIGVIVGGSTVVSLLLAVPSGYLLDALNGRLVLVVTSALLAVVTGAFAWAPSALWIGVLMLLQATLSMWVWLALQANITYVNDRPRSERQLNAFSLAWGIGMAAGPALVAAIYDVAGFEYASLGCFALVVMGTLAAPFTPNVNRLRAATAGEVEGESASGKRSFRSTLRASMQDPVIVPIMVCGFINIYVFSLRTSFYPVFLERIGLSLSMIGTLLSIIGATSVAVRLILPWGVRRFGNLRLLIWTTWVVIAGMALIPVSPHLAVQVCAAVMVGIGLGSNPVISVNILAASKETAPGIAMGLRLLANRIGQVVQPLIFGGVAAVATLTVAFPASAVLLGLTTVWAARRLRRV